MERKRFALGAVLLALAMGLLPGGTAAQQAEGTVTGIVRNATTGQPLAGVQILIQGTQRGALTGQAGTYTLTGLPPGTHTIEARSIGFQTEEETVALAAGETASADFTLEETAVELDAVIVTGQGTKTELRKLSANVNVLSARNIEQAPVTDVGQLLQGRVPGATVQSVSAQPGQAPLVRFRGVSSVFASQTPVVYIDGVRVDNSSGNGFGTGGEQTSALAQILASDIDRIEITKGGAASTLYGSDAATGVIQIFTKKGIAGRPQITARVEQGLDRPETKFLKDVGFSFPDLAEEPGFNPDLVKDELLKNGYFQNYHIGVSGGNEGATYNVSGRIQNSTGVQVKNENTIYALRAGIEANVTNQLNLTFTGNYTRDKFQRLFNGTAISDPLTTFEVGDALFFSGAETLQEALDIFTLPDVDEEVSRFTFGTTASYQPSPLFSSRFTIGVDSRSNEQRLFEPIDFVVSDDIGRIDRYNRAYNAVTLDFAGTFSYPQEGTITSNFTFGVQGFREDESEVFATGRNFSLPGIADLDAAAIIEAFENNVEVFNGGVYVVEQIGLWDRLFLESGVRLDGNSAFGEDVGLQVYPKLGAAYTISDEPWWREGLGDYASAFKLRLAYGETGKFPSAFSRDRTFTAVPFRGESAPRFQNPGNPDLKPEVTATLEGGFDAGLFDNRLGVTFTAYRATTRDALFFVDEQPATGGDDQLRNVGEIQNTGIELSANLSVIRRQNLSWEIGAAYNTVENEVTDLGGIPPFSIGVGGAGRVDEGKPVGAYFVNTPIDTNNDGLLDSFERQYVGSQPYPTQTGSFFTDVTLFQTLTLNALADWATGGTVIDYGSAWASFNALERVTFPTRYSLEGEALRPFSYTQAFSSLLLDGDYWKLREIGARYLLPASFNGRLGVDRATIYAAIRNVYTWVPDQQCLFADACLSNLVDPELSGVDAAGDLQLGGASSITLPPPRSFRLGIEISF